MSDHVADDVVAPRIVGEAEEPVGVDRVVTASLEGVGATEAQVRQRADRLVQDDAGVVENLMELAAAAAP